MMIINEQDNGDRNTKKKHFMYSIATAMVWIILFLIIQEGICPLKAYAQEKKISFGDKEKILVEIKNTKSKVNNDPFDGRFFYKGSNLRPQVLLYSIHEIEDGKIEGIPESEIYINEAGKIFQKDKEPLKNGIDYIILYPSACKSIGKYELTIKAAGTLGSYEGSRKIPYEIIEKEHIWGEWRTTVKQTVFRTGKKERVCSVCKKAQSATVAKSKPSIKVNMKTITLKVKSTTSRFRVSGLASGDYVKSYKSSNKKIFTVSKKGEIKAKKKGTAKLTVTLASGKKATAKVKVQNGAVKTSKLSVNTSKLVLLKGGSYTLKSSVLPLTSQQKIIYSSSNKKIASVSSKGVIRAKKKGKVKITVRSGNKRKRISVTVQMPTFHKGDSSAFLNSCQKIAKRIMADGNWIYYTGSGVKKSFVEARDSAPRQTNCASYVNFCMQDFGTLEPGMAFYGNSQGKLTYNGSASSRAAAKKMVEKYYDIINVGGKKPLDANLHPGDICLYKGHTNVYAGLNSEGVPMWYDAGRNSTSDGKQSSGYFTNMYRASYYNSLPVYVVLRLKK